MSTREDCDALARAYMASTRGSRLVVGEHMWSLLQRQGCDMSLYQTQERIALGLEPLTQAESARVFLSTRWG